MSVLRTTSLSLLLAATLGLAACGGDDATSNSGTGTTGAAGAQPTSAAAAAVEEKIPQIEKEVQQKVDDRRERLEKITKDIQSGKVSGREGQKKIDEVVKEIQKDSGDLTEQAKEQAAAAAGQSGEKVTELDLNGDSADSKK